MNAEPAGAGDGATGFSQSTLRISSSGLRSAPAGGGPTGGGGDAEGAGVSRAIARTPSTKTGSGIGGGS